MLRIVKQLDHKLAKSLENIYQESIKNGKYAVNLDIFDDYQGNGEYTEHTYFLWEDCGVFTTCVQAEQIEKGILIHSLETAPEFRQKGFAKSLLSEALTHLGDYPVYVHIRKNNHISLTLHQELGFQICNDFARLLDGTVSQNYYTLVYKIKK